MTIRCIVWDFDGTLVLSNRLKRDGFLAIADGYAGGRACMEEILAAPPGDRTAIMAAFAARRGGEADVLVRRYSAWCEEQILICPERPGASDTLRRAREAGLRLHIDSATPAGPLRALVLRRYGEGFFDGIYGGHGAKVPNLEAIMAGEGLDRHEIVMIGDGFDDRDAARKVGCHFIGVAEGTLQDQPDCGPLVTHLEEIWPLPA